MRKVAERISAPFGDLRGVLVGGCGDMKRKLLRELPAPVRARVLLVADLPNTSGAEALRSLAAQIPQIAKNDRQQEADGIVDRFMNMVAQTSSGQATRVCYGDEQTRAALRMGAVERLLVERGRGARWAALAASSGVLITEVDPTSELGCGFCSGFGIGGLLRYAVDLDVLEAEEDVVADDSVPVLPCEPLTRCKSDPTESDEEKASTVASETAGNAEILQWIEAALVRALRDTVAAESLTACADVILFGGDGVADAERLESTVEMLRDEGVPDDVLAELVCHVTDTFDLAH